MSTDIHIIKGFMFGDNEGSDGIDVFKSFLRGIPESKQIIGIDAKNELFNQLVMDGKNLDEIVMALNKQMINGYQLYLDEYSFTHNYNANYFVFGKLQSRLTDANKKYIQMFANESDLLKPVEINYRLIEEDVDAPEIYVMFKVIY